MQNIKWTEVKKEKLEIIKKYITKENLKLSIAIIKVGDNDPSNIYIKNKIKALNLVGIDYKLYEFNKSTNEELLNLIDSLNKDSKTTSIMIQLPLPININEDLVINKIDPLKDVDGLTNENQINLINKKETIIPCTTKGIMTILNILKIDLEGKNIIIVGRSKLVGLPLFNLLNNKNATVTLCHSKTTNLDQHLLNSDIIITSVGNIKNLINRSNVKKDSIVIDVATTLTDNKLHGDADYETLKDYVKYITPVPKGVGQMTVLSLIENIIECHKLQEDVKK